MNTMLMFVMMMLMLAMMYDDGLVPARKLGADGREHLVAHELEVAVARHRDVVLVPLPPVVLVPLALGVLRGALLLPLIPLRHAQGTCSRRHA